MIYLAHFLLSRIVIRLSIQINIIHWNQPLLSRGYPQAFITKLWRSSLSTCRYISELAMKSN